MDQFIYLSPDNRRSSVIARDARPDGFRSRIPFTLSPSKPIAFLFRQIASPNFELLWFLKKSKLLGFEPVIIEHINDRFSFHNVFKRALVSPPTVSGRGRDGRVIWSRLKILHHDVAEGAPLNSIYLSDGTSLIDYHHKSFSSIIGADCPSIIDLSELIPSAFLGAHRYYNDLLGLLLEDCVLFEDFVVDRCTEQFFSRVVKPAFESIASSSGRAPKIARLIYGSRAALPVWNFYPSSKIDSRRLGTRAL